MLFFRQRKPTGLDRLAFAIATTNAPLYRTSMKCIKRRPLLLRLIPSPICSR